MMHHTDKTPIFTSPQIVIRTILKIVVLVM